MPLYLVNINNKYILLVINAQLILMRLNVLHAIFIIIEYKILMEIIMDNVYVKMAIMMIIKIVYVNNVLNFGYYS